MEKILVKNSGVVHLKSFQSENGTLYPIEVGRDIPIDVKRLYYVTGLTSSTSRGAHTHKRCEQYIFCPKGAFTLHLDDGETKQSVRMDDPSIGVRLGALLWHSIDEYTDDCVLLVAASEWYDESDYIRDYDAFRLHVQKGA